MYVELCGQVVFTRLLAMGDMPTASYLPPKLRRKVLSVLFHRHRVQDTHANLDWLSLAAGP